VKYNVQRFFIFGCGFLAKLLHQTACLYWILPNAVKKRKISCNLCHKLTDASKFTVPTWLFACSDWSFCYVQQNQAKYALSETNTQRAEFFATTVKCSNPALVVARAPTKRHSADDFLPCTFCMRLHVKKNLYRHDQSCRFHPDNVTDNNMMSAGRALLAGTVSYSGCYVSADVKIYLFSKMTFDCVQRTAVSDPLTVQLGSVLFQKLRHKQVSHLSTWSTQAWHLVQIWLS